ncbi:MAG TPA: cation:proton antiporter, partial [Xenococcaceae cyanobacterium]
FGAKVLTTKNLLPWQAIAMNIATLGTVITFAKFIFLPHHHPEIVQDEEETKKLEVQSNQIQPGFWWAMLILLGGLIMANIVYYEAYTIANIVKPLITIGIGWLAYLLIFPKLLLRLPRAVEKFDHLIGVMSLMLILVFWMVRV